MTIYAVDAGRRTNAQAIEDLAELGVLLKSHVVIDLTIGPKAGFWTRWQPKGRHHE